MIFMNLIKNSCISPNVCLSLEIKTIVRLNLINHVLALFRAKFACNQQKETLYLVGTNVRVMCVRV